MVSRYVYSKNRERKRTLKKEQNKKLKGGFVAPACVGSPDVSKFTQHCPSINLHNTNPEANYSLINGEGVLPTPIVMKGGSSCTPIQSQPKPLTFTDYLNRAGKEISGGSSSGVSSNMDNGGLEMEQVGNFQSGGSGFSINPEEMIGGLPSRSKYDSCCQPAVLGNKLVFGNDGNSICGSQVGGKKRRKNRNKKSKTVKNPSHKKTSSKSKSKLSTAKKLTTSKRKYMNKGKKSKGSKRKGLSGKRKKSRSTLKKGNKKGGFVSKYPFTGEDGDFGYLPDDKDYGGKQPYWNVNTR